MTDIIKKSIGSSDNTDTKNDYKLLKIPIKNRDLGAFISSLLGQPQSIQRELSGTFDIDHAWFMNTHHLIEQRIQQQHEASFVDFSAVIFFENGLSRKLNTIQAFESYNEPKERISNGVKLKWTYLLKFPTKDLPERQEITLFVVTKIPEEIYKIYPFVSKSMRHSKSIISYQIDHTERTWGDDMENILREHIQSCFQANSSFIDLFKSIAPILGIILFIILMISSIFGGHLYQEYNLVQFFEQFKNIGDIASSSMPELEKKIDFLVSIQNPELKNEINILIHFFISILLGITIVFASFFIANHEKPSFVVVTDAASKEREKKLKKIRRDWVISLSTFMGGILTSIVGNYIYYYFSK